MGKTLFHIRTYLRWYVLLLLIVISILIWSVILGEDRHGLLTFAVLDVGQGDALFIESPTGVQVLVDGGPNKSLLKQVSKVMPWYDRKINMIVVTNPDRDHYEGFIPLLDKYKVDTVLEPGTTNANPAYEVLENKLSSKKVEKVLARRGQKIDLGGGVYLEILFPDRDISGLSPNDGSIVMRLVYGETSVLLEGDSTSRIEDYLLDFGKPLESTILKVAHHGSRTSSLKSFVASTSPEFAVISSGADNSYGHPHQETLDTFKELQIPVYDTCNNGTLIFKSDGQNFLLNQNLKLAEAGCKSK